MTIRTRCFIPKSKTRFKVYGIWFTINNYGLQFRKNKLKSSNDNREKET